MNRSEMIRKTVEPAVNFFSQVKIGDKVSVIHGHDLDSLCSASVSYMLAKELGAQVNTIASQFNFTATSEILERLNAKFVVFVDLADIPQDILDRMNSFAKVLIVDHHPPKKYRDISYSNPRNYEQHVYMPASYIVYKVFEKFSSSEKALWIACLGTLADHGAEENADIFKQLKKSFPELIGKNKIEDEILFEKSLLGRLTRIVGSAQIVGKREGAIDALRTLLAAKDFNEIVEGRFSAAKKLLNMEKKVVEEYARILDDFLKHKKTLGRVIFYEIKSELNLKSMFSGSVQRLFPNNIIAIAQEVEDSYDVSFRRGKKVKTDLSAVVKQAIEGMPNATGGGHEAASATRIQKKYLNSFLEKLSKV